MSNGADGEQGGHDGIDPIPAAPVGFGGAAPAPPPKPPTPSPAPPTVPLPPGAYLPPAAAPAAAPLGFTGAASAGPAPGVLDPTILPAVGGTPQADRVRKPQKHRMGQVRNPWVVWILTILTLGIYGLIWWFKVNQECGKYDVRITVKPGVSVLALFVPIAGIVTIVKTGSRIADAQEIAGVPERCSGGVGFLLAILLGLHVVYYQAQLNKVWAVYGNPPAGSLASGD